jgi:hypothetical protein
MVYGKGANDGSKDHEEQDAKTFASWGVTYLKNDICGGAGNRFVDMRNALNKTGVPMYYSIHGPTRVPTLANSWRTTRDINNNWLSIIDRAVLNDGFADAAQPGAFNDPDSKLPPECILRPYSPCNVRLGTHILTACAAAAWCSAGSRKSVEPLGRRRRTKPDEHVERHESPSDAWHGCDQHDCGNRDHAH